MVSTQGLAGYSGAVRRVLEKLEPLKWLAFVFCLAVFGFGTLATALEDTDGYADVEQSDWIPTNWWLKSAECARRRRVWLAICEGDKLVPMSERSFGDDPGHALFLGIWSMATDKAVSFVEVARLNVWLDAAGFVVLAGFLFALRAYVTSIMFLMLGPAVYLRWNGISPHWGLIGVASMALILPMALIARERGFLSRRSGTAYVAVGFLGLAVAALVREAIGLMAVVACIGVIGALVVSRLRSGRRWWGLLALGSLALVASAASTWVVLARDAAFEMEPAQRVRTHNFSHTLYIGLGAVPNAFGIRYDDAEATSSVERVAPQVVVCTPEYYRVLWRLYWSRLAEDPVEVMRIYVEKAKLLLEDRILDWAPPLALVLVFTMAHLLVATAFGIWRRIDFSQGLLVEGAALVFIGFFVAQGILAHPGRFFAMPVGAALLMIFGALLEFGCRLAMALVARRPVVNRRPRL